jgi:hypothetical protein
MVLCTLARNHLKMTRYSSMRWNWNDLNVCFRAEKIFQQSSVHHWKGILNILVEDKWTDSSEPLNK